jgi:GT2 family glycosyltransferase
VDNNSSDGSVEQLRPAFPEVKFYDLDDNIGFGRANNYGFEKASGKYILILNPDTVLEEDTLRIMKEYMDKHSEVGISGCRVLNPDGSFQQACRRGFPTPWAAFSKLFGLQKLFPGSKLFSQYNQTFRSIDETYYIDALIGAFMFARREVIEITGGFDPDFFMYGEDLDLCYRARKAGWEVAYVHKTSIIHYKGESTRRSSINQVKHFYRAMEIFARKHYGRSTFFLIFLRLGIVLRSVIAYAAAYRRDMIVVAGDLAGANLSLMAATKIRFGDFLDFPPYAYPTVFIALSVVIFFTMLIIGEYFESRPNVRRAFFGYMISFFFLSSLTYFFKEYAFSRGILLMTIGFSIVISSIIRIMISFFDRVAGQQSDRRILFVGARDSAAGIVESLRPLQTRNIIVVGIVGREYRSDKESNQTIPYLGNIDLLPSIVGQYKIDEVIITDSSLSRAEIMALISSGARRSVRYHLATEYDQLLASEIISEIAGIQPTLPKYNITLIRNRMVKRIFDIFASLFLLTIGLPVVYLLVDDFSYILKKLAATLRGKYSIVGIYPTERDLSNLGKLGVISLGSISRPKMLSQNALKNLNEYYLQHYSFSLDIDIMLKYLFRKK